MNDETTICGSEDIHTERLRIAAERGIITDWQDAWLLAQYPWYIDNNGYIATSAMGGKVYLHHCIVGQPIREVVDHRDRNPTNNLRSNLRYRTHAANLRNNNHPLGQTGERGTTIDRYGRYLARVNWNGTTHHLGTFDTLSEAVEARKAWIQTNTDEVSHG